MCVPFNSNEDWITTLAAQHNYPEVESWRPWTLNHVPSGYVTTYKVPGAASNFSFITIKDAGKEGAKR